MSIEPRLGHEAVPLLGYSMPSGVTAFSTTRAGGVSKDCYAAMNVNAYCGDNPADVAENRRRLACRLGLAADRIIIPHQTHGTRVRAIDGDFLTLPLARRAALLEGVDAVMTCLPDVCVGVSTADCIPVLLADPVGRAVAAVHAGWRGTVGRVVMRVVAEMVRVYGSRPSDLVAAIGPGISLRAFEVGQEVYGHFAAEGFEMDKIAARHDKWHIDLPLCNQMQLQEAGVRAESIFNSGICTYHHADQYFSARRLGRASGRIYSGIFMRSEGLNAGKK